GAAGQGADGALRAAGDAALRGLRPLPPERDARPAARNVRAIRELLLVQDAARPQRGRARSESAWTAVARSARARALWHDDGRGKDARAAARAAPGPFVCRRPGGVR